MKKEKMLYIIAVILFVITFIPVMPKIVKISMYILTIMLSGYEILCEGIKNIFKLDFEEDTLMTIAVFSACFLGEFNEACLVILLFKLGEMIEQKAINRSNKSIQNIVDIKAKTANIKRPIFAIVSPNI